MAASAGRRRPRGAGLVLGVQLASVAMTAGWLVAGGEVAPDHGLQQVGVLLLDERVPGVESVDGRPTMVVLVGPDRGPCAAQTRLALERSPGLDPRYGLLLHGPGPQPDGVRPDPGGALARRLALPDAAEGCRPGYALLSSDSRVRYRTYDPGWAEHVQEQEILLEHVDGHR